MNIVVEKHQKCTATLSVEIPAEKVQAQRAKITAGYIGKARVPGFRTGKAPAAIVAKRFDKEITEELYNELFQSSFDEALRQEDLKVLDFGIPQNINTTADGGVTFISEIMLAPEFQLPDYKSISVNVPVSEVPQEEVDAQLNSLCERFAEFKDIEARPAAMGDFAVIDYSSTVDGKPTDEFLGKSAGYLSGREGFWVRLDEKAFLPGFAAQLEGLNVGDSREITLTMPEDFPVADLQNRELIFQTTLKELKEAILPELNDELIARIAPGKTLAEVTEIVRLNMQAERARMINEKKVTQIVDYLVRDMDFELPEELVTRETQSQADSIVSGAVKSGIDEELLQAQQDEIFASASKQALTSLRTNFILQEIARVEEIRVSDSELVNHLAKKAQSRNMSASKFIKEVQRSGNLHGTRSSLLLAKVVDFLVEHAEVIESEAIALTEE